MCDSMPCTLDLQHVSLLAHVPALRSTQPVRDSRRFVDVSAEKFCRLLALHPRAQRRTARMFSRREFVQLRVLRRKMDDQKA